MLKFLGDKELRGKLLIVLICLGLYKVGMHVLVPGIDREVLGQISFDSGVLGMVNTFTGGAVQNFSIFAVGIMPYITASIIVQLLQMDGIKILTEWSQQGEMGRKKLKYVTYILAVVFSILQSAAMTIGYGKMFEGLYKVDSFWGYSLVVLVLSLGTIVLMVLGEVIEKWGIGKGISMIILGSLVMSLPATFSQLYEMKLGYGAEFIDYALVGILLIFIVLIMLLVVYMEGSNRRIPIQTAVSGTVMRVSKSNSFMPFKINPAGVIPVIFASALFMMPATLGQYIGNTKITGFINSYLSHSSVVGIIVYALLIISFTFFYAFIQVDPEKIAKNLKESGSYIPTIRPGASTQDYLRNVILRLTTVGSLFLGFIAVVFMVMGMFITLPEGLVYGGTAIIIIVSVGVDLVQQLGASTKKLSYSRFINNK